MENLLFLGVPILKYIMVTASVKMQVLELCVSVNKIKNFLYLVLEVIL